MTTEEIYQKSIEATNSLADAVRQLSQVIAQTGIQQNEKPKRQSKKANADETHADAKVQGQKEIGIDEVRQALTKIVQLDNNDQSRAAAILVRVTNCIKLTDVPKTQYALIIAECEKEMQNAPAKP